MIKGIILGFCIATFIVSLIFISTSAADLLKENIITGRAIGEPALVGYSFVAIVLSFVAGLFVILGMRIDPHGAESERKTDMEKAYEITDFILRLARDSSREDNEVADTIADQLVLASKNNYFPEIFTRIDPDQYHSETKLLEQSEKQRLRKALELYQRKYENI